MIGLYTQAEMNNKNMRKEPDITEVIKTKYKIKPIKYGLVGYMVVNSKNFVEYGYNGIATYTASLKDIAEFIKTI